MNLILNIVGWAALAALGIWGAYLLITGLIEKRKGKAFYGYILAAVTLGLVTIGSQMDGSVLEASFGLGMVVMLTVAFVAILIVQSAMAKPKATKPKSTTEPVAPATKPSPTPHTGGQPITRSH